MATKTTIYSFNATVQNANTNQARNLALQGLYNNMIATPPTGWTLIASTIPTPTTSLLVYSATYDLPEGFRVIIKTTTSATTKDYLYFDR